MRFAALSLFLCSAIIAPAQITPQQEILALDAKWYDAWLHSDAATMNQIEGDDMIVITSGVTPSQLRPAHKSRNMTRRSAATRAQMAEKKRTLEKASVRVAGDTAILNAIQTEISKDASGKETTLKAFMTTVWVKRAGQWELINAQWTDIPEADFNK